MSVVVTYIFLAIGITMFAFTLLLLTARKRTGVTMMLGAYILCLGYVWLYYGLYRQIDLYKARWLIDSELFAELLAGPFLYRYTMSLIGTERPKRTSLGLLQFLPAALFLVYFFLFKPDMPAPAQQHANPDYFSQPLRDLVNTASDICFFSFVGLSTAIVVKAYRRGKPEFRKAFRGVLAYYSIGMLTFIGFVIGHFLRSDSMLGAAVLINGINTNYLFFLSNRYPERTQRRLRLPGVAKGASLSSHGGIDVQDILARLEKAIMEDDGYRNPDLSLSSLSVRLGIQHHQLSRILNEDLGMNFRSYLNRYRIEEAKRLLLERPDVSILDIAYEVGFNSKSAFNTVFAKETGLSPTEYRKARPGGRR
jgi:AraC-like DNA-binding protein